MRIRSSQGFALIDVLFVCGIIGLLSLLAMPRLLMARQAAGAASALGAMRAISSAQLTFALTCGGGFYSPRLTVLGTPPPASTVGYISPNLSQADTFHNSGYTIQMAAVAEPGAPPSCNGLAGGLAGRGFKAGATPLEPTNSRHFAINANAQIWEHSADLFTGMPETGDSPDGHLLK